MKNKSLITYSLITFIALITLSILLYVVNISLILFYFVIFAYGFLIQKNIKPQIIDIFKYTSLIAIFYTLCLIFVRIIRNNIEGVSEEIPSILILMALTLSFVITSNILSFIGFFVAKRIYG